MFLNGELNPIFGIEDGLIRSHCTTSGLQIAHISSFLSRLYYKIKRHLKPVIFVLNLRRYSSDRFWKSKFVISPTFWQMCRSSPRSPLTVSVIVVSIPTNFGKNHFFYHFHGEFTHFIQLLASWKFDDFVHPEKLKISISPVTCSKSPVLCQKCL
jgi:hypothetical protein